MKIVIASDKFKGTLSSIEVATTIELAAKELNFCDVEFAKFSVADGGEGSLEAVIGHNECYDEVECYDALLRPQQCKYALLDDKVILAMSDSVGLNLLQYQRERDPLYTSSFGFGIAIRNLIELGHNDFMLTLGGSATNDAGAGMLAALGCNFFDKGGFPIDIPDGESLLTIGSIEVGGLYERVKNSKFTILT